MGIATGTALVIGAVTSTAGSAGVSFAQAGKQRRLQQQAEEEAAKALAEARKKLDVNYYENLAINKEPYELEREALVSAGAQAIQAGQESERGAAATAGRIQMAQQQGQRQIAGDMGAEMLALNKLTAQEDAKLAQEQAKLYLGEAEGAQLAARDAQQAATKFTTAGVQGIANAGMQIIKDVVPLYPKTGVDAPVAGAAEAAKVGISNQPFQGTPFAPTAALGLGQIAPQAARPIGASPLSQFQIPALGAMNRSKLDLMSREELLKLLTGGK